MIESNKIQLFEGQKIRSLWDEQKERLLKEGNQTVTNCHQLRMLAQDGKMRKTKAIQKGAEQ